MAQDCLQVTVLSIGGDEICRLEAPRDITVRGLKEMVRERQAECTVNFSDHFCFGAETWEENSKPLQQVNQRQIDVTLVKREGFREGDSFFYIGPSLGFIEPCSGMRIERGELCQIARTTESQFLHYRPVIFDKTKTQLRIHHAQLSRSPPSPPRDPLPVGQVFFYTGPPRAGENNALLKHGTAGEVVEPGLISDSLRLRFENFPALCSVELKHLSKDPPRGLELQQGRGCTCGKLCLSL
eukprot:Skav231896  [mRNA]  locus=scaffold960:85705:86822:- [translate_table: standard]